MDRKNITLGIALMLGGIIGAGLEFVRGLGYAVAILLFSSGLGILVANVLHFVVAEE